MVRPFVEWIEPTRSVCNDVARSVFNEVARGAIVAERAVSLSAIGGNDCGLERDKVETPRMGRHMTLEVWNPTATVVRSRRGAHRLGAGDTGPGRHAARGDRLAHVRTGRGRDPHRDDAQLRGCWPRRRLSDWWRGLGAVLCRALR